MTKLRWLTKEEVRPLYTALELRQITILELQQRMLWLMKTPKPLGGMSDLSGSEAMRGWRFCPHGLIGWSYNTARVRRFCRICAKPQRLTQVRHIGGSPMGYRWVDVENQ